MLFKMLGIEKAAETRPFDQPKIRQMFVTQSRVLALRVAEYFAKLQQSLRLSGDKTADELAELKASRGFKKQEDLVDLDDDDVTLGGLPERFSELEDVHFPLFLSFDQVRPTTRFLSSLLMPIV